MERGAYFLSSSFSHSYFLVASNALFVSAPEAGQGWGSPYNVRLYGAMQVAALGSWQVQPCRIGLQERGQTKAVPWSSRLGVRRRATPLPCKTNDC